MVAVRSCLAWLVLGTTLVPTHWCCALPSEYWCCSLPTAAETCRHDAGTAARSGCCAHKSQPASTECITAARPDWAPQEALCCRDRAPAPPAKATHLERSDATALAIDFVGDPLFRPALRTNLLAGTILVHGPPLLARLCRMNC